MAAEDKARYNRELQVVKASARYERLIALKPAQPPKQTTEKPKEAMIQNQSKAQQIKPGYLIKESKTKETKPNESKPNESKTEESKPNESKTEESKTEEPKTEEPKTKDKSCKSVSFAETVTVKHIPMVKTPPQTSNGQKHVICLTHGNLALDTI